MGIVGEGKGGEERREGDFHILFRFSEPQYVIIADSLAPENIIKAGSIPGPQAPFTCPLQIVNA